MGTFGIYRRLFLLAGFSFGIAIPTSHASRILKDHALQPGQDDTKQRAFFESIPVVQGSVDIGPTVGNGYESACQATPIENTQISEAPQICRASLFTAHHCVAEIALSSSPQRKFTIHTKVGGVSVLPDKYRIFTRTGNHANFDSNAKKMRGQAAITSEGDSAIVTITTDCFKLKFLRPVALGDLTENGIPVVGDALHFQKRLGSLNNPAVPTTTPGNPGGGRKLLGRFLEFFQEKRQLRYGIPTPQGGEIVGGDSGGGIFDSAGRLVGAISGSSVPNGGAVGTFNVTFDAYGLAWAKQTLASFGGGVAAPPAALAASPAPSAAAPAAAPAAATPAPSAALPIGPSLADSDAPALPAPSFPGSDAIPAPAMPGQHFGSVPPRAAELQMPSSGERYLVNGQWREFIPLNPAERIIAIFDQRVPPNAIGYRLGGPSRVIWVTGNNGVAPAAAPSAFGAMPAPSFNPSGMAPAPSMSGTAGLNSSGLVARGGNPASPRQAGIVPPIQLAQSDSVPPAISHSMRPAPPPSATPTGIADIDKYERGMTYSTDGSPREKFPAHYFTDIPNGNSKMRIAYFGARNEAYERAIAAKYPLIELKHYASGTPEEAHASRGPFRALLVDGLGRKVTRYGLGFTLESIIEYVAKDEMILLQRYLAAKANLATPATPTPTPAAAATPPPPFRHTPPADAPKAALPGAEAAQSHAGFVGKNCISCHNGVISPRFPEFVHNPAQWEQLLVAKDSSAIEWIKRFNSKVVHGEMLRHAGLSKTQGPGKAFHDLIAGFYDNHVGRPPAAAKMGSSVAELMIDPAKQNEYMQVLKDANLGDPELKRDLMEFDAVWDHTGNPTWSWAARDGDAGSRGARPVGVTTPAGPVRPHLFKYVNGQWKWKEPFDDGVALDSNTTGLERFITIRFPRDAAGNLIKGVRGSEWRPHTNLPDSSYGYSTRPIEHNELPSIFASFPVGTKVFEVLYSKQTGQAIPVDVLVREKRLSPDGQNAVWATDGVRADSSPEKIREWALAQSGDDVKADRDKILAALTSAQPDGVKSDLGEDGSGGTPFVINGQRTNHIAGSKSILDGVSPTTLAKMYRDLPMESAAGSKGWQLEPRQMFSGSHRGLPMDSKTCANCHNNAGETFGDTFMSAGLPANSVIAYGNVQGYDGVLSAPWFSNRVLAQYGTKGGTPSMEMRPEWGKFFEDFDPTRHSASTYRRTERYPVNTHPLRGRPEKGYYPSR